MPDDFHKIICLRGDPDFGHFLKVEQAWRSLDFHRSLHMFLRHPHGNPESRFVYLYGSQNKQHFIKLFSKSNLFGGRSRIPPKVEHACPPPQFPSSGGFLLLASQGKKACVRCFHKEVQPISRTWSVLKASAKNSTCWPFQRFS